MFSLPRTLIATSFNILLCLLLFTQYQWYSDNPRSNWIIKDRRSLAPPPRIGNQRIGARDNESSFFDYLHWKNENQCLISYNFGGRFMEVNGHKGLDGQKSVCMDPGVVPNPMSCLVYSFGIADEWSFDEALENYGCWVYSFDPSMGVGNHSHSARVQFFNLGLGAENIEMDYSGWRIATLQRIRQELGHSNQVIDYLKIDIEGDEWAVLRQLLDTRELTRVKQLALEVHFEENPELLKCQQTLQELEQSGFVRFSSLPNYFVPYYFKDLDRYDFGCYEMTWFNSNFSMKKPLKKRWKE